MAASRCGRERSQGHEGEARAFGMQGQCVFRRLLATCGARGLESEARGAHRGAVMPAGGSKYERFRKGDLAVRRPRKMDENRLLFIGAYEGQRVAPSVQPAHAAASQGSKRVACRKNPLGELLPTLCLVGESAGIDSPPRHRGA